MSRRTPPEPDLQLRLGNGEEMAFQLIPAGEFRMGARDEYRDEEPAHTVRITQPFYLGRFPVTQTQFLAWRAGHEFGFPGKRRHPAEQVTWDEAVEFCAWLTTTCRDQLRGHVACLPTEAEWEYACRARKDAQAAGGWTTTQTEYYTGDGEAALKDAGWYSGNAEESTHDVGGKEPNELWLYDMHGNVDEWCWDAYDADAYKTRVDGVADPGDDTRRRALGGEALVAAAGGGNPGRVIRGGSWFGGAWDCRSAYRVGFVPGDRFGFLGFRVCVVPGPVTERTSPEAELATGDGARRDAGAESEGAGGAGVGPDLSRAHFRRAAGTRKKATGATGATATPRRRGR